MLCTLIGAIILSINIQVGLNMHLYDDIRNASSSFRGPTFIFVICAQIYKDDLKQTQQAIEKVHTICLGGRSVMELIAEIQTLYSCLRLENDGLRCFYLLDSALYRFIRHILLVKVSFYIYRLDPDLTAGQVPGTAKSVHTCRALLCLSISNYCDLQHS